MMPTWMKLTVGAIVVVASGSILVGLASPDGSVGDARPQARPTATPSPAPATTTVTADEPSGTVLAPASVSGAWPGRPREAVVAGGTVDWCPAVTTTGAAEAEQVFGREAVDAAACAAVSFVLDHRYSRLSLPRRTYAASDFEPVLPLLDPTTAQRVYRPRIASFLADHTSDTAGEQLGLVLFTAPVPGHAFYGTPFTTDGYRHRAAWINPRWSAVKIRVDRSMAQPRIEARFTASAAVPVFATASRSDAMLTVPTRATFLLRRGEDGTSWLIHGWTITRGDAVPAPLSVR